MSVVRRYWVWIVAALVIAVVLLFSHRHAPAPGVAAPAVQLTRARRGEIALRVLAHGRVGPPPGSSSALAFQVTGKLEAIAVHVGDRVAAGQELARLDVTPFELAVEQAGGDAQAAGATVQSTTASVAVRNGEAAATAHQADLKVSADESALSRVQALYAAGVAAQKDVQAAQNQLSADLADARTAHLRERVLQTGVATAGGDGGTGQARADVLAAQGQAQRAQAGLEIAQRDLQNATLHAPSAGVVIAVLKHPGESVDPSSPVIALGAPFERAATLSLPAQVARRVHVGDPAELHVARSPRSYRGAVTATVSAVDPITQQATIVVNGVPETAFAGDAVDASIIVAKADGILVPTSAIVQDPQSGDTLVFVASTNATGEPTFQPRKVIVGASDGTTTQIQSGLHAGERVATEGAFELLAPAVPSGD